LCSIVGLVGKVFCGSRPCASIASTYKSKNAKADVDLASMRKRSTLNVQRPTLNQNQRNSFDFLFVFIRGWQPIFCFHTSISAFRLSA